jgi:hypothetical protein
MESTPLRRLGEPETRDVTNTPGMRIMIKLIMLSSAGRHWDATRGRMTSINCMKSPFGATVDDVDVSSPLDDTSVSELVDALYAHRILVIRAQELSAAEYARFGACWGDPLLIFMPGHRDDDFPELIKITNSPKTTQGSRNGANWHSDSTAAGISVLHALRIDNGERVEKEPS